MTEPKRFGLVTLVLVPMATAAWLFASPPDPARPNQTESKLTPATVEPGVCIDTSRFDTVYGYSGY
jgi:hypothetical protein